MNERKSIKRNLAVVLTIIGFIILTWFIYRIWFYADQMNNPNVCIDLPSTGQIGDFIGGFIGTIFSFVGILLLFETLDLQRKEFSESKKVFEKQQFENTFFELLKLHQQNVKAFETQDILGNKYVGRDFFNYQKEYMEQIFIPTTFLSRNRKNAIHTYQLVYTNFEDDFSVYYRTLFQLYNFISNASVEVQGKKHYAKILRAQLTNAELLFIRYNAMTESGSQSANYINEFNLLKHLSHFDLLEFKDWWNVLSNLEKNGLGTIFKDIKSILKNFLIDPNTNELEQIFKRGRYTILLESPNNSEFSITITTDYTKNIPGHSIIDGLDHYNRDEIENLLKCLIKEYIIHSNFNKFNSRRDLFFDFDNTDQNIIKVSVRNFYGGKIKIHQWY